MDLGQPSVHGSPILTFGWIRQNTPVGLHVAVNDGSNLEISHNVLPGRPLARHASFWSRSVNPAAKSCSPTNGPKRVVTPRRSTLLSSAHATGECLEKRGRKALPHGRIYQNPALREQRVQLLGFELIDGVTNDRIWT
jgi:hypothetical protein